MLFEPRCEGRASSCGFNALSEGLEDRSGWGSWPRNEYPEHPRGWDGLDDVGTLGWVVAEQVRQFVPFEPPTVLHRRVDAAVPECPEMCEERLGFGGAGPAHRHPQPCRLRRRELVVPEPLRQPFPGLDASLGEEARDDVPRIAPAKELTRKDRAKADPVQGKVPEDLVVALVVAVCHQSSYPRLARLQ